MTDKKGFAERASIIKKIKTASDNMIICSLGIGICILAAIFGVGFENHILLILCLIDLLFLFCFGYHFSCKFDGYLEKLCEVDK